MKAGLAAANIVDMKRNLTWGELLVLGSGLIGLGAHADSSQPLPTPFPEARYQRMTARSPFAVASATAAATAAPTPGFAAQLYVDGIAHADNTDFVAIKTRAPEEGKPAVVLVEVGKTTEDGIKVESVKWSDEMGKSTVAVSKGGERATLIFDEAQMVKNAGAPMTAVAPQPPPGSRRLTPMQVRHFYNSEPLQGNPGMSAAGPLPMDMRRAMQGVR